MILCYMILYIHMCFVLFFFVMDIVAYDPTYYVTSASRVTKKTTGFAQKSGHPLGPEIACDLTN